MHAVPRVAVAVGLGFSTRFEREVGLLSAGDVFIWVGPRGRQGLPWGPLAARNVSTVYYQTEPIHHCQFLAQAADKEGGVLEIWDYSLHNLHGCARIGRSAPRLRFIPPGSVAREAPQSHSRSPNHTRSPNNREVVVGVAREPVAPTSVLRLERGGRG